MLGRGEPRTPPPPPPVRADLLRFRPGWVTADHVHDHWGVAIPLRGLLVETGAGGRTVATPGEMLCIEPGLRHRNACGTEGCRHLLVQVSSPDALFPWDQPIPSSGARALHPEATEMARGLAEAVLEERDPGTIRESAVLLVASLESEADDGPAPPWLARVRPRVVEDPRSPPGLDDLASIAGAHPSTVLRRYRARYGATPSEFHRRWRLEEAALRIREGSAPLSWIAAELGFADQSHLTRLFRRRFGITPGAYRAHHGRRAG